MYHPRLKGDYYQMGFAYGSLLYKNGFIFPKIEDRKVDFGIRCLAEITHIYPEIKQEIEGFAKAVHTPIEHAAGMLLSIGAFEHEAQCSLFAVKTQANQTIIGRNFDSLFRFQKYTESSLVCPKGKLAYIGQSEIFIGKEDGINQAGLFIGMAYVNGKNPKPGLNFLITVRYALEHFTSVEETIHFFETIPVASYNNFLVADAYHSMAVIEACPERVRVRRPAPGQNFINCTNRFLIQETQQFEVPAVEWSKSTQRYCAVVDYLTGQDEVTLEKAKTILSDKKSNVCLNLKEHGFGTLWSIVANLNTMEIFRAEGQPKITNYRQETRLSDWMKKTQTNRRQVMSPIST